MDDPEHREMTFVQLANLATSSKSTAVWVDALCAMFGEARQNEQMLAEALAKSWSVLRDAPLKELASSKMRRLLLAIDTPFKQLEACLLSMLAAKVPRGKLSFAHICLAQIIDSASLRFLPFALDDSADDLPLEYDPCYGDFGAGKLPEYFDRMGTLQFELGRFRQAAVYLKCALATCDPSVLPAPSISRIVGKLVSYELVAFHRFNKPLPSHLIDLEPLNLKTIQLVSAFNELQLTARPNIPKLVGEFCHENEIDVARHLECAYQIAWLHALHTVMPKIPLATAEESGAVPPLELLSYGYNASFDGQVFILNAIDQWASLESCLKVVNRLAHTKKLSMPELDDDVVFN